MIDALIQDLRHAVRGLVRAPGFAVVVVLTLALGIGANTAIFSVVDRVLLRPAPFGDVQRLMMVWGTDRKSRTTREPLSIPDFADFQERSKQFSALAAITPIEVNLTSTNSDPRRLAALAVTREFLPMVGLTPLAGRWFTSEEARPGGPNVAIISESLRNEQFAADGTVVERTIRVNDIERTVVGIMPDDADFGTLQVLGAAAYARGFAERGGRVKVDVWIPLRADPRTAPRSNHSIFVIGRLAPTVTAASAQQELTAIAGDLERAYLDSNDSRGVFVEPLEQVVFGPVRPALYVLLASVALVLLVACGNVANLLLVRAAERGREVAVRTALGAGLEHLARQFFAEGTMLVLAGTSLGVMLSFWGVDALVRLAPPSLPRVELARIDARVLAMTLGVSFLVTVAFGFLPMLYARRQDQPQALRGSGQAAVAGFARTRLRSVLVAGELAMATMLMVGAGLLVRSLWNLQQVDAGFASAGVLKAEYQLPASRYPLTPGSPERRYFYGELTSRLMAVPGVQFVALAGPNPLQAGFTSSISIAGREAEALHWPEPSIRSVSASYFETLRVPVITGRTFESSDETPSAFVVVINEAASRLFFAGRDAIGQAITLMGADRRVVGIVGNERFNGLTEPPPPAVYLPVGQAPFASAVLVRTAGDPVLVAPAVRRIARELDPMLPLFGLEPLADTVANSQAQRRFTMTVLVVFAAVALILAIVGVHGVLSYTVTQRTREIGVRIALGADFGQIRRLVLSQGALLTAVGISAGLGGALLLMQLLTALLFGVGARDPLTFAGVAILLGAVALVACWLPARSAARVDPIVALRYE